MFEQRRKPTEAAGSSQPSKTQTPVFSPFALPQLPRFAPGDAAAQRAQHLQRLQVRRAADQQQWARQEPQRQQILGARQAEQSEAMRQRARAALQRQVASAFVQISTSNQPAQRQAAAPVLQAAALERQEQADLKTRQVSVGHSLAAFAHLPPDALGTALQRQAAGKAALPSRPQSVAEWVSVMAATAQQAEGKMLDSRGIAEFTRLQRQVTQTLGSGFRQDRQSADARYAEYARHLATLQRSPLSRGMVRVVMTMIPQGERPALQRAVDAQAGHEALQRQQDLQALERDHLQRQAAELETQALQPVHERIQARRGSGNPLPDAVRLHLEQGLNADLSRVRLHHDAEADLLSRSVQAHAFTSGQDIFFRAGTFRPNTQSGLELIAHEVTHTVQQAQRRVGPGVDPDAGLEQEARQMGAFLALSHSSTVTSKASAKGKTAGAISRPAAVAPGFVLQRKSMPEYQAKLGEDWTRQFQTSSSLGPLILNLHRASNGGLTGQYRMDKAGGPLSGMLLQDGDVFLEGQDGSKWHGRYTAANTLLFGNVTLAGGRLNNLELRSDGNPALQEKETLIKMLRAVMNNASLPINQRKILDEVDIQANVPLIMAECQRSGITDPRSIAYVMVTASWESLMGSDMEENANGDPQTYFNRRYLNYNGNRLPDDGYRYRGRGFVQLTGRGNYARATQKLRKLNFLVDGRVPDLEQTPDLVSSNRALAAVVLVWGMQEGWFTGVGLGKATPRHPREKMYPQGVLDPDEARWIVNGRDEKSRAPMKTATNLLTAALVPLGSPQPAERDKTSDGAVGIAEADYSQVQEVPRGGYTAAERARMIAGIETGSLDGVKGYFNGNVEAEDWGQHYVDGTYTGLKWQCVEYVRRYYLVAKGKELTHRGNASSWFVPGLANGGSTFDGLTQYVHNHGQPGVADDGFTVRPQKGDILVFGTGTFGHVAIVSDITENQVTFAQQNVPREGFTGSVNMERNGQKWRLSMPGKHPRTLLRSR